MKKWRTMIVEDIESARKHLIQLLSHHPEIEVVATASNLTDAELNFNETQPELLLLDIELPGGTSFDLLPKLSPTPKIIFITAHRGFAFHAFEVNAVDFLLKPVFADRLANALARILDHVPGNSDNPFTDNGIVFLKTDQGSIAVPIRNILHITASGNFTHVVTSGRNSQMIYRTLAQWEQRLPDSLFKRIERSLVVNISKIESVTRMDRNHSVVHFNGDSQPLQIGRSALQRLNQEMEKH